MVSLLPFSLALPEPSEARRGVEFQRLRLLFSCAVECGEIVFFRRIQLCLLLQHPTFEPKHLRKRPTFFPSRPCNLDETFLDQTQPTGEVTAQRKAFGQDRSH